MAQGTRFIFNVSLAILKILKDKLLRLDFCEIDELLKRLKDDEHLDQRILPNYEKIIEEAQQIDIKDSRIRELFEKYRPKPAEIPKKSIQKLNKQTITLPPKASNTSQIGLTDKKDVEVEETEG